MFFDNNLNGKNSRRIKKDDKPFIINSSGAQILHGSNGLKVCKTMALFSAGMVGSFGASTILAHNELSQTLLASVTFSLIAYNAITLGEQRRLGSNFIARTASSFGFHDLALSNTLFNLFNGGAKMFDDYAPKEFKDWFETKVNELLDEKSIDRAGPRIAR